MLRAACLRALPVAFLLFAANLSAQSLYQIDDEPILYSTRPASDRVATLKSAMESGSVKLERDAHSGYLRSFLRHLGVPESSQMLVFSKTSFQLSKITPDTPRAVYFADDLYVGWVQNGDVLEITAMDPFLGAVFYALEQKEREKPRLLRLNAECLQCHASTMTQGVPGPMVRSVYPSAEGQPILSAGTFVTTHSSPLKERWGGWYVSGTHGDEKHLGNRIAETEKERDPPFSEGLLNQKSLDALIYTKPYLTPHSDIVALLVLEHQSYVHNLLTRAGYEARIALRYQKDMAEMMKMPVGQLLDSVDRRLDHAATLLLRGLLLIDEAKWHGPIQGTSDFAREFQGRGTRDRKGRSLRDLDLERRLFRFPLSYLIDSPQFAGLPDDFRQRVLEKLRRILTGEEREGEFADKIPDADKRVILEILLDTRKDLPASWRPQVTPAAPVPRIESL